MTRTQNLRVSADITLEWLDGRDPVDEVDDEGAIGEQVSGPLPDAVVRAMRLRLGMPESGTQAASTSGSAVAS